MPARRVDQGRALRQAEQIARDSYDRIAGLVLRELAIDGCLTKAPGGERREEVIDAFFELADGRGVLGKTHLNVLVDVT